MIFLKILLWLLLSPLCLLTLVLLLLCISVGVRLSTAQGGKMRITLLFGPFFWRLKEKLKTEKQQKKARQKAERKKAKKEQKLRQKAGQKRAKPTAKAQNKPAAQKLKKRGWAETIRALLAALGDYDYPYLKLVKIKRLWVYCSVGGKDSGDVGRRYALFSTAFGNAFPHLLRLLAIRRYNVQVTPDFAGKKTAVLFDVTVRLRPIVLLYAALVFLKSYFRNQKIYKSAPKQTTVSASARKKGGNPHGK